MQTDKTTMKTEAIFADDRKRRYLLKKEWNPKEPKAMILMINPSVADVVKLDYTTLYILNNLQDLSFGSVDIVNLFSRMTKKLKSDDIELALEEKNLAQIHKSAQTADSVIIAWGKSGENNQKLQYMQTIMLEQLLPYKEKLYIIGNGVGESGFHPLAPQVRFFWELLPFDVEAYLEMEKKKEK